MRFPCELLSDPYLTQIRRTATRFLSTRGLTQIEIAKLLQVSQPLVSNYLKKDEQFTADIDRQISEIGNSVGREVGQILLEEGISGTQKAIATGCSNCKMLRQNGIGCILHKLTIGSLSDDCVSCHSNPNIIELKYYRGSIIEELNEIYLLLSNNRKTHYLIPEIGLQIVSASAQFKSHNDIAAFPGRIRKKIRNVLDTEYPTFGSSETLAGLLLMMREKIPNITTIAAIKTSEWLLENSQKIQLSLQKIERFDENYKIGISNLSKYFQDIPFPFLIYNEGNIGFEDISYILCDSLGKLKEILHLLSF